MAVHKWDPLRDLLNLQERMNRLFEESLARRLEGAALEARTWTPLADVYETRTAFVLHVELPGLDDEDVELQVHEDHLVIKGERRVRVTVRPDSFHRMERSHGPFVRSFEFPSSIDPERVRAEFRDGILRLELPKLRPERPLRSREP